MSLFRRPRLLAALVAVAVTAPLLTVNSAAAAADDPAPTTTVPVAEGRPGGHPDDQPDVLDRPRNGRDAENRLGANGATAAGRNQIPERKLREMLREDETLWLDRKGRAFYVEEAITAEAATAAGAEPPVAEGPFPYPQTFLLHSKPGSNRTIHLDFNGFTINGTAWNANYAVPANFVAGGFDLDGNPAAFSNAEMDVIQSVWQRVAEDYAPFDVDVTTEDPGFAAIDRSSPADLVYGTRAIITNSAQLHALTCNSNCGGFAYIGVSDFVAPSHAYYQPALVFQNGLGGVNATAKNLAEAVSHEVGHNFGLNHDATATLPYYQGHGAWAPIMGTGYTRPIVQWSRGEYAGATNTEDDIAVMGTHGAVLRPDDHGNSIATATLLANNTPVQALITSATDVDFFAVNATGAGSVSAGPASVSPNLDIRLDLYNSAGTLLSSSDPASSTIGPDSAGGLAASVSIPSAGTYYVRVDGVGFGSPLTTGYSDYGSIGQYTILASYVGPTLSIGSPTVASGGVATVSWTGIPAPTATDWIGLYASPSTNDGNYLAYRYTTGSASGSVPFTIPVGTAGGTTYELRLFSNNGYTRLAISNTFTITAAPLPTITAAPSSIARGGIITATWNSVPSPTTTDWIGLYASSSATDGNYLAYTYATGAAAGSTPLTIPVTVPAGSTYELRLFSNNGYTRLATSNAFTITAPAAATISAAPSSIARGGIITATWNGVPSPTATDWIGLYSSSSATDGDYLAFAYTTGNASGSVPLTIPVTAPGGPTYELRLFSNNGYTRLALSNTFTVTAPAAPTLNVAPSSIARGGVITAAWNGVPSPTATDWIGLYASASATDGNFLAFAYTTGNASGSVPLTIPVTAPGGPTYELRLFSNNGYTRLALSNTFGVTTPALPSISGAGPAAVGGSMTATWLNIPTPSATDWVGLYNTAADPDGEIVAWAYTGGTVAGVMPFALPATITPGPYYQLRLFSNNTFTRLAASNTFEIVPAPPCNVYASGTPVYPAENATVSAGPAGLQCTNSGFRGYGYIGNWSGEAVTFKVFSAAAGRMNIRFRYQNASTDATRTLTHPGGSTTLTFHNTHFGDTSGNWANGIWSELIVNVPVAEGRNFITLSGGTGFIDLDEISEARYTGAGLSGTLGGSTGPGTVYQAETSSFNGIQIGVLTTNPGYLGTGYLGNFGYVGNNVRFGPLNTVSVQPVTRTLRFRYRSAETGARRLISVNNSAVAILDFPNTGATWATAGWAEISVTVSLPQNAMVDVEFLGDSGYGFIDLDQMTVAP